MLVGQTKKEKTGKSGKNVSASVPVREGAVQREEILKEDVRYVHHEAIAWDDY